jgi:hypothetical protein
MARESADREDLMRDASAFVQRAEFISPSGNEPIFVGFRACGALSIYFRPDFAFHFTSAGELRRAIRNGMLYKAEGGTLIELRRAEYADRTELVRRPLSDAEIASLWSEFDHSATSLRELLTLTTSYSLREIPTGANVATRLVAWLSEFSSSHKIAAKPNVK